MSSGITRPLFSETLRSLDVLFVDLPFNTYELGHRFKSAWSYKQYLSVYELHLGFRYMVTSLRARGHTADILFPAERNGLATRSDLVAVASEIRPLVLGLTSYEGSLRESLQFVKQVKARGVPSLICMGGHLATFSYREILKDFHDLVDVIVLGDGEDAIADIVEAMKQGAVFKDIPGLAYFESGRVVTTANRPIEKAIDRFPFPMLSDAVDWRVGNVPLFMITSRGCYGRCSFCRSSHFGEKWRSRDAIRVVDEIEEAYARGVVTFEMVDDNFLGPGAAGKRRAAAIAKEIQRRQLKIRFHISCRVNDVEEAVMRTLQAAGLISVSLGVESGVQRMLDTYNKTVTVEQNIAALELLNRLKIPTLAYIIYFDPYTTLMEARQNLQFLKRVRALPYTRFEEILFRKLIPISGTVLFEKIKADGLLRGNYLSGHHFSFRDQAVAILADFMETIDLRFERVLQDEKFRRIGKMYEFKEGFEFVVAEKAIDLLASARRRTKKESLGQLNALLGAELRKVFRPDLGESAGQAAVV